MTKLSSALVLNKYILHLFGVKDLEALSENLKDAALEGYDENNVSHFYHTLINRFYSNSNLPKELLYQYDQNIYSHTRTISQHRSEPIKWKYFQYLALLFTEIYLDKYFSGAEKLKQELNNYLQNIFLKERQSYKELQPFLLTNDENDLNKIAYWNATGSGKTLLMHINIIQYRYYLDKHSRQKELNRIIVLTPNDGLSQQHLKEFQESGLEAELFAKNGGSLFRGNKIEIIDIHKLEEQGGEKTVAVDSFESNNLVLVDEGHRGSSGDTWKDKRNRLCENGFSFEYSATFGQSVSAVPGNKQKALLDEYGKATLFDYSYRYFYHDGYGKDYLILNINETWNEGYVNLYLTACLLSFFEQLKAYKNNIKVFEPFLIDKPLAIFVGSKVTAVRTENKQQVSDVVFVLKFIEGFVRDSESSIRNIQRLLQNEDGLTDQQGHSIFRNSFKYLRSQKLQAQECYEQLLREIFNAEVKGALLHIDNLKGQEGEIGLRIGNADYFGVINVGDDKKLVDLCEKENMNVDEKEFSSSLFHSINKKDSKINILIGSKKFSEGWSSWRVSMMGLMNIGKGEGSEIIQLFGRGVRLKGYKFSLKRSSALDYTIKPDNIPQWLPILETLNIFGINAKYMEQFKEYLEEEGLPKDNNMEEYIIEILPTIEGLSEKKLKYVRVKEGVDFKKSETVDLLLKEKNPFVYLDWYPKVQYRSSSKDGLSAVISTEEGKLEGQQLAFINWDEIYFELQKFKNERSWYNLNISKEEMKKILYAKDWYVLEIPSAELSIYNFEQVRIWQELATALLKQFCERLYNIQKSVFLNKHLETATLDKSHPNFQDEYRLMVKKSETTLIEKIQELKQKLATKFFKQTFQITNDFEAIYYGNHLYAPLLYLDKNKIKDDAVQISPVALNKGERNFVNDLKRFHELSSECFNGKELYLLRNISKKGISFFETHYFYPDFILWVVTPNKQHIAFIDPKGLRQVNGLENEKIQLHKTIKTEIEPQLNDPTISLHSFIVSSTPYNELKHWRGQESVRDFNEVNVYFQIDQKEYYIKKILEELK